MTPEETQALRARAEQWLKHHDAQNSYNGSEAIYAEVLRDLLALLTERETPQLRAAARRALEEMCNTVAPRDSFTDAVDALDAALAVGEPHPAQGWQPGCDRCDAVIARKCFHEGCMRYDRHEPRKAQ